MRNLPEPDAPETLKAKLLAAVPQARTAGMPQPLIQWFPRAWDFGVTAAAAALILALLTMVNYGLSVPAQPLLTEFNDTSLCYAAWDRGNFLYDQNNTFMPDNNLTRGSSPQ